MRQPSTAKTTGRSGFGKVEIIANDDRAVVECGRLMSAKKIRGHCDRHVFGAGISDQVLAADKQHGAV